MIMSKQFILLFIRICTSFVSFLYCFVSMQGVSHRLSLGAAVCRRPDDQCWVQGGTSGKGKDMEDRDGEKGPTCEHGANKDNGVWY